MADSINPSSMLAIGSVLPALSIIAVCARLYVRVTYKQGLGMDDWLIIPALLMVIGMGIVIIMGEQQGIVGYSLGALSPEYIYWGLIFLLQLQFAFVIIHMVNLGLVKLSILYFYRRIFVTGQSRKLDIFTKAFAGIIVAWTIAMLLMNIFFCGTNVSENWADLFDQTSDCANIEAVNLFFFASDVLLDVILLIIPIPLIFRLQLSRSRQIGIMFVFCVGGLAVVASILRLIIFGFVYSDNAYDFVGQDLLVAFSMLFYWSIFESGMAVIAACLPVLQILAKKINMEKVTATVLGIFSLQSLFGSYRRSEGRVASSKDTNGHRFHPHNNSLAFTELEKTSACRTADTDRNLSE